ncbi:MAG: hypothetical protein V4517_13430, partial [Pseudomonadota bacterium]
DSYGCFALLEKRNFTRRVNLSHRVGLAVPRPSNNVIASNAKQSISQRRSWQDGLLRRKRSSQ